MERPAFDFMLQMAEWRSLCDVTSPSQLAGRLFVHISRHTYCFAIYSFLRCFSFTEIGAKR